jgi:hypothetical protein
MGASFPSAKFEGAKTRPASFAVSDFEVLHSRRMLGGKSCRTLVEGFRRLALRGSQIVTGPPPHVTNLGAQGFTKMNEILVLRSNFDQARHGLHIPLRGY